MWTAHATGRSSSRPSDATPGRDRISCTRTSTATSDITRRAVFRSAVSARAMSLRIGSSGDCEWDGYIPFDQLPQAFNPPSGIIATANQNPFPVAEEGAKREEAGFLVNGNFAPPYRVRQIRALLESRPKWRPEEMLRVQTDVYSAFHQFLAKQIVAAWDRKKAKRPDRRRRRTAALGRTDEEGRGRSADRHAGV